MAVGYFSLVCLVGFSGLRGGLASLGWWVVCARVWLFLLLICCLLWVFVVLFNSVGMNASFVRCGLLWFLCGLVLV